jgi:hypothetical protein
MAFTIVPFATESITSPARSPSTTDADERAWTSDFAPPRAWLRGQRVDENVRARGRHAAALDFTVPSVAVRR